VKKQPILILGAGGHGRVAADCIAQGEKYQVAGFLDDGLHSDKVYGYPLLGGLDQLKVLREQFTFAFVALGNASRRLELLDILTELGFENPAVIHPASIIGADVVINEGVLVGPGAVINVGAKIGRGVIVNSNATVEHDCELATGVHLAPGSTACGGVKVGENSWIGAGATVINNLVIGSNVVVGAGAVVTQSVANGVTVVGVPAREIHGNNRSIN